MDDSALEMRLAEEENAAARAGGGAHRAPVALALAAIGSARLLGLRRAAADHSCSQCVNVYAKIRGKFT